MTTHNEAFEKWWANNYSNLDHRDILRTSEKAWKAAKADSEKEIERLKEKVSSLTTLYSVAVNQVTENKEQWEADLAAKYSDPNT